MAERRLDSLRFFIAVSPMAFNGAFIQDDGIVFFQGKSDKTACF